MKYTVNLETKKIHYDKELPGGHLLALRKVFEPQGYEFLEGMDLDELKEYVKSQAEKMYHEQYPHRSGYVTYKAPHTTTGITHTVTTNNNLYNAPPSSLESYRMDIMNLGDSLTEANKYIKE